eukprot:COSAG04_NODE_686_length_11156_cov_44.791806_9_plen_109_part_00
MIAILGVRAICVFNLCHNLTEHTFDFNCDFHWSNSVHVAVLVLSDALFEPLPPAAGGSGAWKGFPSIPLPIAEGEIVVGSAPSADAARERFSLYARARRSRRCSLAQP